MLFSYSKTLYLACRFPFKLYLLLYKQEYTITSRRCDNGEGVPLSLMQYFVAEWEILCTQHNLANSWNIYHLCPPWRTSLFPYRWARTLAVALVIPIHNRHKCSLQGVRTYTAGEGLFILSFKSSSKVGLWSIDHHKLLSQYTFLKPRKTQGKIKHPQVQCEAYGIPVCR